MSWYGGRTDSLRSSGIRSRGNFRFDATPAFTIAGNHDGAFNGNSEAIELFVVFAVAVVHIDQRGGYVTVNRIGVVGWELLGRLARRGIAGNRGFLQLGAELRGLQEFDYALLRRGEQDREGFDMGIESSLFEFGKNPASVPTDRADCFFCTRPEDDVLRWRSVVQDDRWRNELDNHPYPPTSPDST